MPGGRKSKQQHGGYRAPAKPAAVSGPGALAQRTDGGPAQPIRPIPSSGPGGTIGDRAASVALQQGAPLAAAGGAGVPPGAPPVATASAPPPDPFGATNRPWEPVTAGARLGAGPGPEGGDSTLAWLQAAFEQDPYDDNIRDLIEIHQERNR